MRVIAAERTRHFFVRAHEGETLPDALAEVLRVHEVRAGWARGHGVLADVELRAIESGVAEPGRVRTIAGPVRAAVLDCAIGESEGDLSLGMRVVVSFETATGVETVAGELVSARVVGLEAHVVSMEDARIERAVDRAAGVWLWNVGVAEGQSASPTRPANPQKPASAWGEAIEASERREAPRPPGRPASTGATGAPVPPKPPAREEEDAPYPEAGDVVEHFAFGRCEVLKSDGDRLHLKLEKDGRIREIALEMLKVTPLPSNEPSRRRYRLDRKL